MRRGVACAAVCAAGRAHPAGGRPHSRASGDGLLWQIFGTGSAEGELGEGFTVSDVRRQALTNVVGQTRYDTRVCCCSPGDASTILVVETDGLSDGRRCWDAVRCPHGAEPQRAVLRGVMGSVWWSRFDEAVLGVERCRALEGRATGLSLHFRPRRSRQNDHVRPSSRFGHLNEHIITGSCRQASNSMDSPRTLWDR